MTTRQKTKQIVEKEGRKAITIAGDIGDKGFCDRAVKQTVDELGGLDILVNNAGEQHPDEDIGDITDEQLRADVPDEHVRHVLSDPGSRAAPEEGLNGHQLHVGDDVQRLAEAARL